VKSHGIPPFAESAKDGAPEPLWQGKKYDSLGTWATQSKSFLLTMVNEKTEMQAILKTAAAVPED